MVQINSSVSYMLPGNSLDNPTEASVLLAQATPLITPFLLMLPATLCMVKQAAEHSEWSVRYWQALRWDWGWDVKDLDLDIAQTTSTNWKYFEREQNGITNWNCCKAIPQSPRRWNTTQYTSQSNLWSSCIEKLFSKGTFLTLKFFATASSCSTTISSYLFITLWLYFKSSKYSAIRYIDICITM